MPKIKKLQKRLHIPPKHVEHGTKGSCPYCHKFVQNLEAHINAKHKGEKRFPR